MYSLKGVADCILEIVRPLAGSVGTSDVSDLRSRMDSNFNSVCDGVSKIHEVLETFWLAEGEEGVNIPEALKYVFNMRRIHAQSMRTPVRDELAENDECWYNTTN